MTKSTAMKPRELEDLWEVAVALPIFHTLTYRLPEDLKEKARVGSPVRVPAKRRVATGCLLGPARGTPEVAIRSIQEVLDPLPRFGPELVPLFRWLADYYQYPLGEALSQIIPGGAHLTGPRHETLAVPQELSDSSPARRPGPRARVMLA